MKEKNTRSPRMNLRIMSGGHLKALTADELVAHRLRGHVSVRTFV